MHWDIDSPLFQIAYPDLGDRPVTLPPLNIEWTE